MTNHGEAKDPERKAAGPPEVEGAGRALGPERKAEKPPEVEGHVVYIIECEGGWLYVGYTSNLLRRWREHQRGGARFTKGRPPVKVVHVEWFATRGDAERRERQLKGWTRAKKLALAAGNFDLLKKL